MTLETGIQRPPVASRFGTAHPKPELAPQSDFTGLKFMIKSDKVIKSVDGYPGIFGDLHNEFWKPLFSQAKRLVSNPEVAEDITQDTFKKAMGSALKMEDGIKIIIPIWLFTINYNGCMDQIRRDRLVRWEDIEDHYPGTEYTDKRVPHPAVVAPDNPEREVVQQEECARVRQTIERLSPALRMALVLREYQGLSCEEIAVQMRTTQSAIKSKLFRARKRFKREWTGAYPDDPNPHLT